MTGNERVRGERGSRTPHISVEVLSLGAMIFVQTAGIVWWASGISNRVGSLEETVKPLSDGSLTSTLARIDERTGTMKDRLNRLGDRIYSMPTTAAPPAIAIARTTEHEQ